MPVLASIPAPVIKQFFLPSTASLPEDQQGWVKMDVSPMNVQDSLVAEIGDTPMRISARVLAERIKEWNYTEENGTPIPISFDSVIRLQSDLNYLASQIPAPKGSVLSTEQKKS